jgi:hypothetical protein
MASLSWHISIMIARIIIRLYNRLAILKRRGIFYVRLTAYRNKSSYLKLFDQALQRGAFIQLILA